MKLKYAEAKTHLREGDVLLFRSTGFPSIGYWITTYTGGVHSHVGIVHKNGKIVFCVEQREFKGGRMVDLERQVSMYDGLIDVYRALPEVTLLRFDGEKVVGEKRVFTEEIARKITDDAMALTGSSYGWKNIWKMFRAYAPFIRLWRHQSSEDVSNVDAFVCSTLVAYTYGKHYVDPCPNLSDIYTNPADIARSPLFNYLFTLVVDGEEVSHES